MSIDLTLSRIRVLASHLSVYTRPTCHIAGTNGKGSVVSLLSSIFAASTPSLSVGRFNSPHLVSIYDSIVLDGKPVSPQAYHSARNEVEQADKAHNVGASSFELLTLTALRIFERARVDIAVIEVGMGGRLDATNVIPDECVLVSALASVDLDHQAFLGPSVTDIAREKAGIARKGKPFVIGPQRHAEVFDVVKGIVETAGGTVLLASPAERREWDEAVDGPAHPEPSLVPSSFRGPPPQPVRMSIPPFDRPIHALLPLYGEHQLENLGLAAGIVSALLTYPACTQALDLRARLTPESIARGTAAAKWPGRLSFHTISLPSLPAVYPRQLTVLADGAHNPASSATLGGYISELLAQVYRPISLTFVIALSHSPPKTPLQTLAPLLSPLAHPYLRPTLRVALVQFSQPEGMPWVRCEPTSEVAEIVRGLAPIAEIWEGAEEVAGATAVGQALEWAADKQGDEEGLVVIAGSLYLIADFYRFAEEQVTQFHEDT